MQKYDRSSKDEVSGPRGRGRPRAFDRDAALSRATQLFWTKGYEATSIADLIEVMEVGSTSLYAAFGSKEALYAEALQHYLDSYSCLFWSRFEEADTAREAVRSFLMDSAAALTGCSADIPRGCMATLSNVEREGHAELGELVRMARGGTPERIKDRLRRAMAEGELPSSTDLDALARFVQAVQSGMSILARDGAGRSELEETARIAMLGWDAHIHGV